MDIQKIINDVIAKLKADDNLLEKFKTNPVKVLEDLTGIDLPDDKINAIIDGIKAKLNLDDIAEKRASWARWAACSARRAEPFTAARELCENRSCCIMQQLLLCRPVIDYPSRRSSRGPSCGQIPPR